MEGTGQHNLSIALRHILQQIVDSTNPSGQKNTDMTLPHDGYIQRLSWYFECDRCHYKAFYCHEMESHKRVCYMSLDLKFLAKKRKLAAPKRVSSTTHPPNEDSDQDSQQSTNLPIPVPKPAYSVPIHINRSSASSIVTPSAARPSATATATSIPLPKLTQSTNIIPMEPTDIEFDPGIPSPDYDVPTIPEIDNQSQQHLDFDNTPSKDNTDMDDQHKNEPTAALSTYDPDILEIKVEVEPSNPAPRPSLPTTSGLSIHSTPPGLAPHRPQPFSAPAPSDPVFPGSSDLSIDSMMNYFATQPPQHTISTPPTSRIDHRNPAHSLPELSIGNVTSLKKPMIKHNPHALSQMPNVKRWTDARLVRKVLMNPGPFTTLMQVKYSMPTELRPILHGKITSIMLMLEEKGYGTKRNSAFYKNPNPSTEMLQIYGLTFEKYWHEFISTACRYGTTQSSGARHVIIHKSLYGENTLDSPTII